jgi:hypothetical protein
MRQLLGAMLGLALSSSSMVLVYSQSFNPSASSSARHSGTSAPALLQKRQESRSLVPVEEFSFLIKDFKVDHQTENLNVNISISYRYVYNITKSEYPDFRLLAKDVEAFLTNYPNEDDYWEIVNKQVTSMLLRKYRALASLTCEFKVDPSPLVPYTRFSRVTRTRPNVRSSQKRL